VTTKANGAESIVLLYLCHVYKHTLNVKTSIVSRCLGTFTHSRYNNQSFTSIDRICNSTDFANNDFTTGAINAVKDYPSVKIPDFNLIFCSSYVLFTV
jgi:exopolysaccharide biosynthesis protein